MDLEKRLTSTLHNISSNAQEYGAMSWKDVIPFIDLTQLDSQATPQEISALAAKAGQYQVAAICVLPNHLDYISENIPIKRATVVNFPTGQEPPQQVLNAVEKIATCKNIDEIDYVFPYQTYLTGDHRTALACCHQVYQLCKQNKLTFKVILETGELPSIDVIYALSTAIINSGCDFLKTSTGKTTHGATIPAVFSMLSAIVDSNTPCGIKVSGGIKTMEQSFNYMRMAQYMFQKKLNNRLFRIGASSLLDDLLQHETAPHQ